MRSTVKVYPGEYHPQAPEVMRRAGGVWRHEEGAWEVPWARLPLVVEGLRAIGVRLTKKARQMAEEALRWREGLGEKALEALEGSPLFPEQREDAAKALAAFLRSLEGGPSGFLLANGTGTGKTFVYAGFLRGLEAHGLPSLVVLPNSDLARQVEEVLRLVGTRTEITSYAKLTPERAKGRVLVLDEAHLAKRAWRSGRGKRAWLAVQQALFTLFATATPFDRPWEAEYLLAPTRAVEAWGYKKFANLMKEYRVYRRNTPWGWGEEYYFVGEPEDLLRFHRHLRERGFLTRRLFRPPEGLVEHEVPLLSLPEEGKELLEEVRHRMWEVAGTLGPGERGPFLAQRTLLSRAILERLKLQAAFGHIEALLEEGWHVILFLQYKAEKALDLSSPEALLQFLVEGEERGLKGLHIYLGIALAGFHFQLSSPVAMVRERFGYLGEALAFYTGSQGAKALKQAKEAWEEGKVRLLVATAAKGGTGLSLHDVRGGRPTAQVVLTLPWTGGQLDQILGRAVRVGMRSPVKVLLPVAQVPAEREMASVLATSLRTLGYAVRGGEMPVPERVVEAFLADYAAVDEEGFLRLLDEIASTEHLEGW